MAQAVALRLGQLTSADIDLHASQDQSRHRQGGTTGFPHRDQAVDIAAVADMGVGPTSRSG
jgi:hypothetical protein